MYCTSVHRHTLKKQIFRVPQLFVFIFFSCVCRRFFFIALHVPTQIKTSKIGVWVWVCSMYCYAVLLYARVKRLIVVLLHVGTVLCQNFCCEPFFSVFRLLYCFCFFFLTFYTLPFCTMLCFLPCVFRFYLVKLFYFWKEKNERYKIQKYKKEKIKNHLKRRSVGSCSFLRWASSSL